MNSYLKTLLTTREGITVMENAEKFFAGAAFSDLTAAGLADWQNDVFSKVKNVYGASVNTDAGLVNVAMKAWLGNPNDIPALGNLMRTFDELSTDMMNNPPPVSRTDDAKAFKESCFSTMATMALIAENASRSIPRRDSVEVAISKARIAVTCDEYVGRFGEMPATARIGKDELASEYWESMMGDVAPYSSTENERILKNLKRLEQSTKVDDITKSMDQLVKSMRKVAAKNVDLAGQAEMVFAEAMRSARVMSGGAYRDDQPDHRASAELTDTERKEMDTAIGQRRQERRKEEHADPTGR